MITYYYPLLLSPGEELSSIIKQDKRFVKSIIGHNDSLNSVPHITIKNVSQETLNKSSLVTDIFMNLCRSRSKIELRIVGYHHFGTHTIYAKILKPRRVKDWFNRLWKVAGYESKTPHITVVKDLTPEQFEILWPHFENRPLNTSTLIDHIKMLKRPEDHSFKSVIFKIFTFDNGISSIQRDEKELAYKSLKTLQYNLF